MTVVDRNIDDVHVSGRHRSDLGSLDELQESISSVGLLHPIVITPTGRLIAGERRLAACTQLGLQQVAATVIESFDDARLALIAERDENTCRKDMTILEKVALGRELEDLERPKAVERQGRRTDLAPPGTGPVGSRGRVRDVVGETVGMSGRTYQRAKHVVEAAELGRPGAKEALALIEKAGRVTMAYEQLRRQSQKDERKKVSAPKEMSAYQRKVAEGAKERVERAVGTCNGIQRGFPELKLALAVNVASHEDVKGWDEAFGDAISAIRQLRKRLKEVV